MSSLPSAVLGVTLAIAGATVGAMQTIGGERPSSADLHVRMSAPLRDVASASGHTVGVAVRHEPLMGDEDYQTLAAHDFDMITLENELKWSEIHETPGVLDLQRANEMVDFAADHGMAIRGHTLVWHRQNPDWLDGARLGRDQAIELLRVHIEAVVGEFRGRIAHWDVVNEPIDPSGHGLRETFWLETIGDDYLDLAFDFAHQADPNATLFLNDYDAVGDGTSFSSLIDLAIELRERGVPVHGVGFQHHLNGSFDPEVVAPLVARAGAAGLEVAFTEVDDRLPDGSGHVARVEQARRYAALAQVCVNDPACTTFVVWGLGDRYSWIPGEFPGQGAGTLFDEELEAKPAYHFVVDVFRGAALRNEEVRR